MKKISLKRKKNEGKTVISGLACRIMLGVGQSQAPLAKHVYVKFKAAELLDCSRLAGLSDVVA